MALSPSHTSNHTPHSVPSQDPPENPDPPGPRQKTSESDLENLELLYSAIDDIFDSTIKNADSAVEGVKSPTESQTSAKPAKEQLVDNPAYIPTARMSQTDPVSPPPQPSSAPPIPLPRTRSSTEIIATPSNTQQQQESAEVKGQEAPSQDHRILAFEELSKNYAQLQLEVQKLKKEIQNNRELEGELYSHFNSYKYFSYKIQMGTVLHLGIPSVCYFSWL